MYIIAGLVKALDIFEERENDRTKIVVLLCDGDVNYNQRTIDRYKEAGPPKKDVLPLRL